MRSLILQMFYILALVAAVNSDVVKDNRIMIGSAEGRFLNHDDNKKQKYDGSILTPKDYMKRRRPTLLDSKTPIDSSPVPKVFNCKKDLPAPTKVSISVHVSEISLVTNGAVTVSAYLRYSWEDYRFRQIAENAVTDYVELASSVKELLWLPDLYIPNAATVISPVVFVPPTSFRVYTNSTIFANQYLLLQLSCPFNYALFPMDVQICDVALQSFGRNPCELNLTWAASNPLTYSTSTLSQFSYEIHKASENAHSRTFHSGSKSALERAQVHMYIILKRNIMFYMMQIYIPSMLFVVVSWISFLIPAEMAQGRMLLTITTMLTMVSLFAAGSEYVPKASYVKAIDVWMCLCTFLSFFAVVNCLVDIRMESMISGEGKKKFTNTFVLTGQARRQTVVEIFRKYAKKGKATKEEKREAPEAAPQDDEEAATESVLMGKLLKICYTMQQGSLFVYPIIFILFNIVYWSVCLTHMDGPSPTVHKEARFSGTKGAEITK